MATRHEPESYKSGPSASSQLVAVSLLKRGHQSPYLRVILDDALDVSTEPFIVRDGFWTGLPDLLPSITR